MNLKGRKAKQNYKKNNDFSISDDKSWRDFTDIAWYYRAYQEKHKGIISSTVYKETTKCTCCTPLDGGGWEESYDI